MLEELPAGAGGRGNMLVAMSSKSLSEAPIGNAQTRRARYGKRAFSSQTDLWATPQWLYDTLDLEFHFTVDWCATPENAKCERFYTKSENSRNR